MADGHEEAEFADAAPGDEGPALAHRPGQATEGKGGVLDGAELGVAGSFADRGEGTEHRTREKESVGDLARLGDNDERLVRGEEAHGEDQAKG